MKYISVKQSVEEFCANTDVELAFVFHAESLKLNKFKQMQGSPCIIRIRGDDGEVRTYNYLKFIEEIGMEEDFTISFKPKNLPGTKYVVLVIENKLKTKDDFEYYPHMIRPLAKKSEKVADEAQKEINDRDAKQKDLEGEPFVL